MTVSHGASHKPNIIRSVAWMCVSVRTTLCERLRARRYTTSFQCVHSMNSKYAFSMNDLHVAAAAAVAAEVEAATSESSLYYCFAVACLRSPINRGFCMCMCYARVCMCVFFVIPFCSFYSLWSVRSDDWLIRTATHIHIRTHAHTLARTQREQTNEWMQKERPSERNKREE